LELTATIASQIAMEIPMAKQLSTAIRKHEPWHPEASDGLLVTGTWSVIVVSLGTFLVWLLL
jgi:hypothetical protein